MNENAQATQNGGCPIRSLKTPFNNLLATFDGQSQVLRFNFVPVQSAIDYQDNVPDDHDIFAETATTLMANTPFDVIIGEVNGMPGYPQEQLDAEWVPSTYEPGDF